MCPLIRTFWNCWYLFIIPIAIIVEIFQQIYYDYNLSLLLKSMFIDLFGLTLLWLSCAYDELMSGCMKVVIVTNVCIPWVNGWVYERCDCD